MMDGVLFRTSVLVCCAALLFPLASVLAWEPRADGERADDPSWYRAGEAPDYSAPGYHDSGRYGGAYSGPTDFGPASPGAGYSAGAYSGTGGNDWNALFGGQTQPAPTWPGAGQGPAADTSTWRTSEWPARTGPARTGGDTGGHAAGYPFSGYSNPMNEGYRFRGDQDSRENWTAPYWRAGSRADGSFGGYRFRDDERLDGRAGQGAGASMYRFRPLEPDENGTGSGQGFEGSSGYPYWRGYDFRPE